MKKSAQQGFSLVELLVSMAIIAILAGLVAVSFQGNEIERLLDQEARNFASFVREAQNNAITGQVFNGQIPTAYAIRIPLASEVREAIMYADINGDATFQTNEEVRRITLNRKVQHWQVNVDIFFLTYKTIDGFCWDDYLTCSGEIDQLIAVIQENGVELNKRQIRFYRDTGKVEVYD